MLNRNHGRFIAFFVLLLLPVWAHAQTGPELLLKPWPRDRIIEAQADTTFYNQTTTDHPPADGNGRSSEFTLSEYSSSGRARLFPRNQEVRADPRFGYDATYLKLDTNDPRLPKKLTDVSVGAGVGIADIDGWLAGVTFAVGYAGAGAFQDGNGYYGKADLAVGREFGNGNAFGIVLDYNGNRSFLPDVPLIGAEYRKEIDPTLLAEVGFPLCSLTWTPDKSRTLDRQLTVDATYTIPDSLDAKVDYALIDSAGPAGKVALFLNYSDRTMPFHDNDLAVGRYRIFFEQRRVEIGTRWTPKPLFSLIVAGGYAFDQSFSTGWDTQNYSRIDKPGDELYVRTGLEFRY